MLFRLAIGVPSLVCRTVVCYLVRYSALVKYVAVCVRVCWYCHQSGGTDVVDLPDILLPAGQYLDMFDSESETDLPGTSSDEELVEV